MDNLKMELRSLSLEEIEEVENTEDDDELFITGNIVTNSYSHVLGREKGKMWREVICPGVFSDAISRALDQGRDINFLDDHNDKKILSSTSNGSLTLLEDENALHISSKISKTSWGKDVFELIKDRLVKGLSFGMKVLKENWQMSPDGVPLRTILAIDLFEISAVMTPAYSETMLESRGIDVISIPEKIEKREMNNKNMNDEQEFTEKMFYDGLTLIADKLDAILNKMDKVDADKTAEDVIEAKEILAATKAVVEQQSATIQQQATLDKENKEANPEERDIDKTGNVDIKVEDAEEVDINTDAKEAEIDSKKIEEPDAEEVEEETKETHEEKNKTEKEFRDLFSKLNLEVPEIE